MTSCAVALGLAVLVAGCVLALRGSLLAGCAAVLVLSTCFNHQLVSFDLGSITLTLDRLALVGLVAAYAFQRWRGGTDPKPLTSADWILAALLALLVANTLLAGPRSDGGYVPGGWRLVAGYLVPGTLYWVARESRLTRSSVAGVVIVLAALGVYLAGTGVLEILERWDLVFPPHIADPSLGIHFGRARGPMLHSMSMGIYLGVGGLAAAQLLGRGCFRRALLCALLPLFLAALLFTYTRSVYLGVAFGTIVWCSLTLPRLWQRVAASAVVVALLALTFAQHGFLSFQRGHRSVSHDQASAAEHAHPATPPSAAPAGPAPRSDDGNGQAGKKTSETAEAEAVAALRNAPKATLHSAYMRLVFAWVSWQMFLDRPLFGVGLGHFGAAKLPYLDAAPASMDVRSTRKREHHIHYLGLLTETGAVGLALFLALLTGWGWLAWRLHHSPDAPPWSAQQGTLLLGVLPIFLMQWTFHELSHSPGDHGVLFLLAGIAVGLQPALSREAEDREASGKAKPRSEPQASEARSGMPSEV